MGRKVNREKQKGKIMKNWDAIEKKIVEIETQYECEIVTVITGRSSNYMEILFWYALALSVITYVSLVAWVVPQIDIWFVHDYVYGAFAFSALLLFTSLLQIPGVGSRLVSNQKKAEQVKRSACESFYQMNIDRTQKRRALLIFVSKFERKFFLIPDMGFHFEKEEKQWDILAEKMKSFFKMHPSQVEVAVEKGMIELQSMLKNNKIISKQIVKSIDNGLREV